MNRAFPLITALLLAPLATPSAADATTFDLSSATVADINAAFAAGALTSEKLVALYLARIAAYEQNGPKLNAIITLNPKALETARVLDAERRAKGPRSPLHGIPILVKDVFDTYDLPTSGGFKPMATSQPSRDSFIIDRLRKAGTIILGKNNQGDWYASLPQGCSSLSGQVLSPYNLSKHCGATSTGTGSAIAAWFATVGLGSDTAGSITYPTALSCLAGFSTTHGLVSRTGMMWHSPSQENAGPMGRSVYDCAAMLDIIAGYDAADLATQACIGKLPDKPYTSFVAPDGLKGARLGVLREMFRPGPLHAEGKALGEQAIADIRAAGAIVIDPVLTGMDLPKVQLSADASHYETAIAIDTYLARLPPTAPIRSVTEMIAKAGDLPLRSFRFAKLTGLERNLQLAAVFKQQDTLRSALLKLLEDYQLDALILPYQTFPTQEIPNGGRDFNTEARNCMAAYTGLPTIIVPCGFFPSDGMPLGFQFIGRPFAEPTLIKVASGYEAFSHHRKPAPLTPPLAGERFDY